MSERGIFRKKIGMRSGCARCCFSPLAEHLMLQKYLDLRPPLFRIRPRVKINLFAACLAKLRCRDFVFLRYGRDNKAAGHV